MVEARTGWSGVEAEECIRFAEDNPCTGISSLGLIAKLINHHASNLLVLLLVLLAPALGKAELGCTCEPKQA